MRTATVAAGCGSRRRRTGESPCPPDVVADTILNGELSFALIITTRPSPVSAPASSECVEALVTSAVAEPRARPVPWTPIAESAAALLFGDDTGAPSLAR